MFHHRCDATQCHIRSVAVVCAVPSCGGFLFVGDAPDVLLLRPHVHDVPDVLGAMSIENELRLSTPRDELMERARNAFGRERHICLVGEAFAIGGIEHVEETKHVSVAELIVYEIHPPRLIDRVGHREKRRRGAYESLLWFVTEIEVERAIDPVRAFVIPIKLLYVAQMEKAQAEAP